MAPVKIWKAVLGELQLSFQRPVFDNWLKDTSVVAYEDGCFVIATPNAYAQEWLEQRMKSRIKQCLQKKSKRSVDLRFIVRSHPVIEPDVTPEDPPLLKPSPPEAGRYRSASTHDASALNPSMTFDTFIEGDGNRFACAAAQAVAHNPGERFNPLFLHGGVGLGKTHLLHSIGNRASADGYSVRYVTSETFTNDLIEAIRTKTNVAFRQTYRDVDVLLIDDIQFIEGKISTQNEFFHTFNSLYATNKQIVITSDQSPEKLAKLEERLRSRFNGGLTVDLQPPDLEHRIAILHAKAIEDGAVVPEDVLRYIAEQVSDNVRDLQGALTRIVASAQLQFRAPDMALAKDLLDQPEEELDTNPESVITVVAAEFRVTRAELTGPRRSRRIVEPRQVSMYILREYCQLSFPQIGECLGGRDHTTAMHGYGKIAKRLESDPDFCKRVEKVRLQLRR